MLPPSIRHRNIRQPILWIVDSEQWPRACLRAELIERGYEALGFISVGEAIDALSRGTSPRPEAFILELRDQPYSAQALDAIRNLEIPTILIAGAVELGDPLIRACTWTTILRRPISLGEIADVVENVLPPPRIQLPPKYRRN
jgi:hypothetical protein